MTHPNYVVKKIHVSLDSILDVRLGTLVTLDTDFAFQVSKQKEYYTREEDLFQTEEHGSLSKENYLAVQKKYLPHVLRNSPQTKIFDFLKELCKVLVNKAVTTPYFGEIEIEINLYPYQFNEEEIVNIIKAVSLQFDNLFSVSATYLSEKQLTIDYVDQHLYALVMYNPKSWLDAQHRDLRSGKIKDIPLYTPMLKHIRALTKEETEQLEERHMDLFQVFTLLMAPFITMQFLPVKLFSANTAENQ